jgi:hypothetical protein
MVMEVMLLLSLLSLYCGVAAAAAVVLAAIVFVKLQWASMFNLDCLLHVAL